jgi:hypothetical protein
MNSDEKPKPKNKLKLALVEEIPDDIEDLDLMGADGFFPSENPFDLVTDF